MALPISQAQVPQGLGPCQELLRLGRGTLQLVSRISLWFWSTPFTLPTRILEPRKESGIVQSLEARGKSGLERISRSVFLLSIYIAIDGHQMTIKVPKVSSYPLVYFEGERPETLAGVSQQVAGYGRETQDWWELDRHLSMCW